MANVNSCFDAPIPGQSLTQPVGGSSCEHPPKFTDLQEALDYTWEMLHRPKPMVKMLGLLKAGAPVESLVSTALFRGISESMWTVDLALLMYQTVLWQIEAIAKLKKIKCQTFNQDREHDNDLLHISNLIDVKDTKDKTFQVAQSPTDELQAEKPASTFKGFF